MGLLAKIIDSVQKRNEERNQLVNDVIIRFEAEYSEFKEVTMRLSKSDIYDAASEIRFYEAIRDFAVYGDEIGYETASAINTEKPIAALWNEYTDSEMLSVDSYEDIRIIFENTFPMKGGAICSISEFRKTDEASGQ